MFKFMQFLVATAPAPDPTNSTLSDGIYTAFNKFLDIFSIIMPILIAVVLLVGMVYAIIIGVAFAKAEDTDQRDKAKSRLINVIIGVVVAALLMVIIWAVVPMIVEGGSGIFGTNTLRK